MKKVINLVLILFSCFIQAQNVFIENKGQLPENVISKTYLPAGELYIEKGVFNYVFYSQDQLIEKHNGNYRETYIDAHSYKAIFLNCNKKSTYFLDSASSYFENYFLGEKSRWANNVRSYKRHLQNNLYNGIDLLVFSSANNLKYELHVNPGFSPKHIKIQYEGLEKLEILDDDLVCETSVNTTIEHKPFAYQIINGNLVEVPCFYRLKKNIVSFIFPEGYNKRHKLIIDPTLEFSTFSGSFANNFGYTATYDDLGFLYSGSTVFGSGYPTTTGSFQVSFYAGTVDIGITKYDTSGTQMIYSTYLGGSSDELPHSMVVNSANELFIFGTTSSLDFPTTVGAYQDTFKGGTYYGVGGLGVTFNNGSDIFVSRLSASGGDLLSSTYIGGTENDGLNIHVPINKNYADEVRGEIDIDNNNNIYIATCTKSSDFPITNTFQQTNQGNQEGCILKMDNQLSTIIWSSYLGGSNHDGIFSLALDNEDNIIVTGGTISNDFPVTAGAYQTIYLDSILPDAFITHISSDGSTIINSTFFGEQNYHDQAYFIELNSQEEVYIYGQTKSPGVNLVANANYFVPDGGQFISVFSKDLKNLIRSTVFGTGRGTPDISPTAFLVDVCGNIYIAGWGSNVQGPSPSDPDPWTPLSTANMPITNDAYQSLTTGHDIYLMVIDDLLDSIVYATYLGGDQSREHVDGGTSRFDKKGTIYHAVCAGCGGYSDFPIEPNPGAVSNSNNGVGSACNSAVFKFDFNFPIVVANFSAPLVSCNPIVSFQNASTITSTSIFQWDFGDGSGSNIKSPTHNYSQPGIYDVTLIVSDQLGCNISDTILKKITILSNTSDSLLAITKCKDESVSIGITYNDPNSTYTWFPTIDLSSPNIPNPICTSLVNRQYYLIIEKDNCKDTLFQKVNSINIDIETSSDTTFCKDSILLEVTHNGSSLVWSSNIDFSDTLSQENFLLVLDTGIYYVKSQLNFCYTTDSIKIFLGNINLDLPSEINFCKDSILLELTHNGSYVIWSSNYNFTDTISNNTSFFVSNLGIYYAKSLDGICFSKDSISVVSESIDIILFGNDTCEGGTVFVGVTNLNPSVPIINYTWQNLDIQSSTIIDTPETSKWYVVEVVNSEQCIMEDSIFINVHPYPIIDSLWVTKKIIYKGEQVAINVQTNEMVFWKNFNSNEKQQLDLPMNNTCYNISVFNEYNCTIEDSICVKVLDVFCDEEKIIIPTAFSPNQDGINETYFIIDEENIITEYKLEIFNRLGQKVFSSKDIYDEWDGRFNGKKLNPQVLDFYVEVKCAGNKELFKKGNITLIR